MAVLSVIIPSRLACAGSGGLFLEQAVRSIRAQQLDPSFRVQILAGIDQGAVPPEDLADRLGICFVEAAGKSQAAALNGAAGAIKGDYLAFLEDDDQWNAGFLSAALSLLGQFDFCSASQLEIDPEGRVLRVNDFPTPSGWVMRRQTWERVGLFDTAFRFHLDNDWLGRLGESGARRAHLVEAIEALDAAFVEKERPLLGTLLKWARPGVHLVRHTSPEPLVVKLCHPGSGIAHSEADAKARQLSQNEYARLIGRFGHVPW